MTIKNRIPILVALGIAIVAVFGITACNKSEHDHGGSQAHQYTCSMHPEVVQAKPGKCPKCGMDLTEKH